MSQMRLFVSHSHVDNDFCLRLVQDLRWALGGDENIVWYDQSGGLQGGDQWWRKILAELKARSVFLVVLSPDSMTSKWVNDEIDIAWQTKNSPQGKLIVPLLFRECDIRPDLSTLQHVSFLPPRSYEQAFNGLLTRLRSVGTQDLRQPSEPDLTPAISAPLSQEESPTNSSGKLLKRLSHACHADLAALDSYWQDITINHQDDNAQLERFHRLAYTALPNWRHGRYMDTVEQRLLELDEAIVDALHDFRESLFRLDTCRQRMREKFESEFAKRLWDDYIAWKEQMRRGNLRERIAANQARSEIGMRANGLCTPLIPLWNQTAEIINAIREKGNPFPEGA